MLRLLSVVLMLHAAPSFAIDPEELPDPLQQQRYSALIHELRCLKCQGETVADTPADFARDIRRQVREMVAAGKSDAEIRDFLVERYGEVILLKPRWSLANAWLWLAPGVLLLGGAFIALRIVRQRNRLLASDTSEVDEDGPMDGEGRA